MEYNIQQFSIDLFVWLEFLCVYVCLCVFVFGNLFAPVTFMVLLCKTREAPLRTSYYWLEPHFDYNREGWSVEERKRCWDIIHAETWDLLEGGRIWW